MIAIEKRTNSFPIAGGTGSPASYHVQAGAGNGEKKTFTAMHLEIQIFEMEQGVYLVDFKCSGYETPEGKLLEEKDITSPFPFLDMAARLIMQLAEAD
jgi:carbon catabolite-derepressing protein kinase